MSNFLGSLQFPVGSIRLLLVVSLMRFNLFPDAVFFAYPFHETGYGSVTYTGEVRIAFLQPVMYPGGRYIRVFFQVCTYILLVVFQFQPVLAVRTLFFNKLLHSHIQIPSYSLTVRTQIYSNLCFVQSFQLKLPYFMPHILFLLKILFPYFHCSICLCFV